MASYKRTPVPQIFLSSILLSRPESSQSRNQATFATNSTAWGGWLANSSSQTYSATEMDYTQPTASSSPCPNGTEAVWTGLGGYNSLQLAQTGTEVPTTAIPLCGSSTAYCAWYELLSQNANNPAVLMSNVGVRAGDYIHTYVNYQYWNGTVNFYVSDNTNHTAQSVTINNIGSSYYDGSTADFIGAEYVQSVSSPALKNFSTFGISNSYAYVTSSGQWTTIAQAQLPTQLNLVTPPGGGGATLASPSSLSGGTAFTMTWHRCF